MKGSLGGRDRQRVGKEEGKRQREKAPGSPTESWKEGGQATEGEGAREGDIKEPQNDSDIGGRETG